MTSTNIVDCWRDYAFSVTADCRLKIACSINRPSPTLLFDNILFASILMTPVHLLTPANAIAHQRSAAFAPDLSLGDLTCSPYLTDRLPYLFLHLLYSHY